jgi:protocatechuate 3,4-dioxygenase beta subunit
MTTDADGRFEFTQLVAGRYSVAATKTGYLSLQYGQRRPTDAITTLTLADGERRDDVNVALPRGGVIVARITDDLGEPLPGAQVQVQRYLYGPDGQRRLNTVFVGTPGPGSATDDRGEVRLYGLPPAEYVVSASVRNPAIDANPNAATSDGFAPTFHPGTLNPSEAQLVTVALGEEVTIEFAMSSARLARVSGTVVDSQGRPAAGSFVNIVTRQGNGTFSSGGNQVTPDGTFTLNGVAPGEYSLEVMTRPQPGKSERMEFGTTQITVAGTELTGVRIVTGQGATLSGRVVFDGNGTRPKPPQGAQGQGQQRIFPSPVDPSSRLVGPFGDDPRTNGTIDETGRFQLTGVSGRIFLAATVPGWTIKSIALDGEDVTDNTIDLTGKQSVTGVVIRMTDRVAQISGKVSDDRGQPARECTVVFQTAEEREPVVAARLLRTVRCESSGSFTMRGIRPGRYVVTAVTSIEQGRQFEPEYQRDLRRAAQSLVIREGETTTLDLKLTSGL